MLFTCRTQHRRKVGQGDSDEQGSESSARALDAAGSVSAAPKRLRDHDRARDAHQLLYSREQVRWLAPRAGICGRFVP
jgi:hypothetical protein